MRTEIDSRKISTFLTPARPASGDALTGTPTAAQNGDHSHIAEIQIFVTPAEDIMSRAAGLTRRPEFYLLVGLGLVLGLRTGEAQTQPSDMPQNLLSRMVPYEQGLANIQAQNAARPPAVQPVLSGDAKNLSGEPQSNNPPTSANPVPVSKP